MKPELPKNQRQLDLYRELSDIHSKRLLTKVLASCYVAVLGVLIYLVLNESPWQNTVILGVVELVLTIAIPPMIKHFFPSRNSSSE